MANFTKQFLPLQTFSFPICMPLRGSSVAVLNVVLIVRSETSYHTVIELMVNKNIPRFSSYHNRYIFRWSGDLAFGLMQFPDDLSGPESSDEEQDVTQLYSSYEEYVSAQVTLDDLFYLEVNLSVPTHRNSLL